MKKSFKLFACAIAVTFLFSACGEKEKPVTDPATSQEPGITAEPEGKGGSITLYTSGSEKLVPTFTAAANAYNAQNPNAISINVQFVSENSGTSVDKLLLESNANNTIAEMDLVGLSKEEYSNVLAQNGAEFLEVMNAEKVPNYANINVNVSNDAEAYAIAFTGKSVVLAYNSDKIETPPATVDDLVLWAKDYPQRFTYSDPSKGTSGKWFIKSLIYNGLPEAATNSNSEEWIEQWDIGFARIKEINPYLYKSAENLVYPATDEQALELLAKGEIDLVPVWSDIALEQIKAGALAKNIKLTQIDPAIPGDVRVMVVPSASENKEAVLSFLNFLVSKEGQEIFVKELSATPVIDSSLLTPAVVESVPPGLRVFNIGELDNKITTKWQEEVSTLN